MEDLSGGEKQRVALARVLLLSPAALLLDEPTSAVDDETAHDILKDIFAKCKENGQTVIMVTHQKEMIEEFAEYILKMKNGYVTYEGSEVYGRRY